jgi:hypothetical protein
VLILLGLVVLVSGCIGQTTVTVTTSNGLVIKSFSPDFSEVRSGEQVVLSMMTENVGEADATDISAELFGLNIGGTEWSLTGGSTRVSKIPGNILRRADPSKSLTGESFEFSWLLNAPSNLRVDNTYTADARVYFKYKTSFISSLRFITYDYLKSLPTDKFEQMKQSAGVVQSKVSGAPIQISATVGNRPLVVYNDGQTFSVQIMISNAGGGYAFGKDANYPGFPSNVSTLANSDLHKIYVSISSDLRIDCSSVLTGGDAKHGTITLTRGKTRTMFCTITIPTKASIPNTMDYALSIDLDYGYYVDSSTSIKVLKVETPGTTSTTVPATTTTVASTTTTI